ncbi:MAG: ribonuclease HI family protein [Candidatus Paceibacterota bacterium]
MKKIILNTDGGSRGNPGIAGAGVAILDDKGEVLKTASKFLGQMTNNEAEYEALIFGLETVRKFLGKDKLKQTELEVRLDSELVKKQLTGEYQVKEERLWRYFMCISNLRVSEFKNIKFTHVLREKNKLADKLANEAMDGASQKTLI